MKRLLGVLFLLAAQSAFAEPSCETVYWGKVSAENNGVVGPLGLVEVEGSLPPDGTSVPVIGADRLDPEAVEFCPPTYKVLTAPQLVATWDGAAFGPLPDSYSKSSRVYDEIAIYDPDGVLAGQTFIDSDEMGQITDQGGAVLMMLDLGRGFMPIATIQIAGAANDAGLVPVLPFSDALAYLGDGVGLVFLLDIAGAPLSLTELRWSLH